MLLIQGMSELPDYHKISFAHMTATPMEDVVPDASNEVSILC